MSTNKILVVWSNYYRSLAKQHLESCLKALDAENYEHVIETVDAGTYEIPAVIQYYQRNKPFDAYLPLGLLLKGNTDHYEFVWEHIKECFIKFAMDGLLIGNGIITAPTMDVMVQRVENHERVKEAVRAISYLMKLKEKFQ